jgi:hypothetical protein
MTNPAPVPLLFGFRGVRFLQVILVLAAGALAIGGVFILKAYIDEGGVYLMVLAVLFAVMFIWLFSLALRMPTSFVAVSPERMRIRFGGFVDTIVETKDVSGARLVRWGAWKGLGVRTGFGGDVALVAAGGVAAELTLRRPIRVWLIPRLWRISATRVVVSVRNPQKLVERFGAVQQNAPKASPVSKRKRR